MKRQAVIHFLLLCLILPASSSVDFAAEELENCMPLRECEPLMHVLHMIRANAIPEGFSRAQMVQQLREAQCNGSSRVDIIVNCPLTTAELEGDRRKVKLRSGIMVGLEGRANTCEGTVRVHVMGEGAGVVVHRIGGRRNNVARAPGYSTNEVFRVQVQGNCCWDAFPNAFRRGRSEHLKVGFDGRPATFRSIQKADCEV